MTIKEFISILQSNNIPDDAILMSDCDWEIHATTIGAVYYCKEENIIALTQNDAYPIRMPDDWTEETSKRVRKWVLLN